MSETESITNKVYSKKIIGKRLARVMAVQCLYSINIEHAEDNIDNMIYNLIKTDYSDIGGTTLSSLDEAHLIQLARGTFKNQPQLVLGLQNFLAENWKFNRLPKLVQAILLVGAYELKFLDKAEAAVIINEYLEIAKLFNHVGEVGFINSVLDRVNNNS